MTTEESKKRSHPQAGAQALPSTVIDFATAAREAALGDAQAAAERIDTLAAEAATLPAEGLRLALEGLARDAQERSLPLLLAVAERAPVPQATAAVAAFALVRRPEAAQALHNLAERERRREIRKEARRSLFRLRAAGVALPEAATGQAQADAHPIVLARVTNVDGSGSRLIAIGREGSLGTVNLVTALVNDERGLRNVVGMRLTRNELPRRLESMFADKGGIHLVDAPADYCQEAILAARELNRQALEPIPPDFYTWQEVIGEPQRHYEREPIYDEVSAAAVRWNPQLLDESDRLLDLPEFSSWLLPEGDVADTVRELARARESGLVLPGRSQREQERRAIDRFVERYFTDAIRRRYQLRLERTAYVLLKLGRARDAQLALAAALALDPASGTPLTRQPLPIRMAVETLELVEDKDLRQRERPGGLLLPPR